MKEKVRREYVITEDKPKKLKFGVFPLWKSYGITMVSLNFQTGFDTYEEAETFMHEKLKKYSARYIIAQIYNNAYSKKEIVNTDTAEQSKYAVFNERRMAKTFIFLGVVKGFDRQDVVTKINRQYTIIKLYKLDESGLMTERSWKKLRACNVEEGDFAKAGWNKAILYGGVTKEKLSLKDIIPECN